MRWASLFVLGLAASILAFSWDRVPARWATHWGADGRVNGWTSKSVVGGFAPIGMGLLVWLLLEVVTFFNRARGRTGRPAIPPEVIEVHIGFSRVVGLSLSLTFGAFALVLPLVRPDDPRLLVATTVIGLFCVLAWGGLGARKRLNDLKARGIAPPKGYGILYRNPHDPRLWVPKMLGIGWTLNFAHRAAWPLMFALVVGPMVIVAVAALLR